MPDKTGRPTFEERDPDTGEPLGLDIHCREFIRMAGFAGWVPCGRPDCRATPHGARCSEHDFTHLPPAVLPADELPKPRKPARQRRR